MDRAEDAPALAGGRNHRDSAEEARVRADALEQHVISSAPTLWSQYGAGRIPIAKLYEAYFDGAIDIPGDLHEFLLKRDAFVKHSIVRQHLAWAVKSFRPAELAHCREADERAARALYDERGNEFFRAFLGEHMVFTCARFQSSDDDLERATVLSHARICSKLSLQAGQRVLEVGCGWGGFLGYAASRCGARGVGVTLSCMQKDFANRRFERLGVADRARAVLADYRDLPDEQFDRIVCLENLERVGAANLATFFGKLRERLTEQGSVLVQWTGLRRTLQPEDLMWGLFISEHVFPGADAPLTLSSVLRVAEKAGWEVQAVENQSGQYRRTLAAWRQNWESNRPFVVARYGERWYRIWRFFFAWSEIMAAEGNAACYQMVMNKNVASFDRHALGSSTSWAEPSRERTVEATAEQAAARKQRAA